MSTKTSIVETRREAEQHRHNNIATTKSWAYCWPTKACEDARELKLAIAKAKETRLQQK